MALALSWNALRYVWARLVLWRYDYCGEHLVKKVYHPEIFISGLTPYDCSIEPERYECELCSHERFLRGAKRDAVNKANSLRRIVAAIEFLRERKGGR